MGGRRRPIDWVLAGDRARPSKWIAREDRGPITCNRIDGEDAAGGFVPCRTEPLEDRSSTKNMVHSSGPNLDGLEDDVKRNLHDVGALRAPNDEFVRRLGLLERADEESRVA